MDSTFEGWTAMARRAAAEEPGADSAAHTAALDDDVVRRVRGGDVDAFGTLIQRHEAAVRQRLARLVPPEAVSETAHDAFVRAYEALDGYRVGTRFRDWLMTLAVRTGYDYWRARYRRREQPESALSGEHEQWLEHAAAPLAAEAFETHTRQQEAREVLDHVLAQLSPEDRLVVSLVHLEGLTPGEAARELGWTAVNVRVRAMRARRRMRSLIDALLGGEGGHD